MNTHDLVDEWEQELLAKGEARGEAKGKAEGEAKGKALGKGEAIVAVLEARGVGVTATARRKILRCADLPQLDVWLRRAAVIDAVRDLFG